MSNTSPVVVPTRAAKVSFSRIQYVDYWVPWLLDEEHETNTRACVRVKRVWHIYKRRLDNSAHANIAQNFNKVIEQVKKCLPHLSSCVSVTLISPFAPPSLWAICVHTFSDLASFKLFPCALDWLLVYPLALSDWLPQQKVNTGANQRERQFWNEPIKIQNNTGYPPARKHKVTNLECGNNAPWLYFIFASDRLRK